MARPSGWSSAQKFLALDAIVEGLVAMKLMGPPIDLELLYDEEGYLPFRVEEEQSLLTFFVVLAVASVVTDIMACVAAPGGRGIRGVIALVVIGFCLRAAVSVGLLTELIVPVIWSALIASAALRED